MALDGLSLWLVLLTTLLTPIAALVSWNHIDHRRKEFYAFLLLLEFGVIGVFVAMDLFLFYVFWEVSLVPMYFLIGIWGHERRIYAAVKFFLFTMAGSVLMLGAIIFLYNRDRHVRLRPDPGHDPDRKPGVRPAHGDAVVPGILHRLRHQGAVVSRCTPGCPTRTWKRPRPVPSCWLP